MIKYGIDVDKFKFLCRKSQKDLKKYLRKELTEIYGKAISADGFVYAQGEIPILLVAHLDTVHKQLPKQIKWIKNNTALTSPQGIGGDDRCGVYMIMDIIKTHKCSVLFCEDEEIGGVGADKFIKSSISDGLKFNYIIEFDRKGKEDAVFYSCDNADFEDFITKDFYTTDYGSFSDISVVAPYLKVAAANLSCGYYNAHTTTEYVVLPEMAESIKQAKILIDKTTEDNVYEYIEAKYKYRSSYGYYDYCWDDYDGYYGGYYNKLYDDDKDNSMSSVDYGLDYYFMILYVNEKNEEAYYEVEAMSSYEAVGKFLCKYPRLCFNDIIEMYDEEGSLCI